MDSIGQIFGQGTVSIVWLSTGHHTACHVLLRELLGTGNVVVLAIWVTRWGYIERETIEFGESCLAGQELWMFICRQALEEQWPNLHFSNFETAFWKLYWRWLRQEAGDMLRRNDECFYWGNSSENCCDFLVDYISKFGIGVEFRRIPGRTGYPSRWWGCAGGQNDMAE